MAKSNLVGGSAQSGVPIGAVQGPPLASLRRPPPMRVVTKGWLTIEEGQADIEELEREDREGQKA